MMKTFKPFTFITIILVGLTATSNAQSSAPKITIRPKVADSITFYMPVDSLKAPKYSIPNAFVKKKDLNNGTMQPAPIPNAFRKANNQSIPIPTFKIEADTH